MKNKILTGILVLTMILTGTGCSKAENLSIPQQDITIAVLTKSQNTEFWETVDKGAKNAAEELGIEVICQATPTEADIDIQISMIDDLVAQGVDGIIVAPLDTSALNDNLKLAVENDIPVLTIDSTVTYTGVLSEIGTQNYSAGDIAARKMADLISNRGEVLIVTHGSENLPTVHDRAYGFSDRITESFKNITITDIVNGEANTAKSKELTIKALTDNPSIKGIYATNETVANGVCEAVKELGLTDKVKIIGFDSSSTEIKFLKEGVLDGMLVQDPYLFGYLGVRNAYKAIKGKRIDSSIDTGITFVNIDNLTDQDIEAILYPLGKE